MHEFLGITLITIGLFFTIGAILILISPASTTMSSWPESDPKFRSKQEIDQLKRDHGENLSDHVVRILKDLDQFLYNPESLQNRSKIDQKEYVKAYFKLKEILAEFPQIAARLIADGKLSYHCIAALKQGNGTGAPFPPGVLRILAQSTNRDVICEVAWNKQIGHKETEECQDVN